jgi:hypothetical protein
MTVEENRRRALVPLACCCGFGCDRPHGAEKGAERLIVVNRRLKLAPLLRPGFFFF